MREGKQSEPRDIADRHQKCQGNGRVMDGTLYIGSYVVPNIPGSNTAMLWIYNTSLVLCFHVPILIGAPFSSIKIAESEF